MVNVVTISPQVAPSDPLDWMLSICLPFWAQYGVNHATGSFIERLDHNATDPHDTYTRIRVQARQLYVFAHAYHLSGDERWAETAKAGFQFLNRYGWQDKPGGWAHLLSPTGDIKDDRRDTYDLAFILFSLAWYYRAIDAKSARPLIDITLNFLDQHLSDHKTNSYYEERLVGSEGGFLPATTLPRRQNPHMHLLEAFLALYETIGDPALLNRARLIIDLFQRHFFDTETDSLGEYFTDQWQPAQGHDGALREPGHHFEWVWLLHRYGILAADQHIGEFAARLYRFALKHGVQARGDHIIALDTLDRYGSVVSASARLWPQTEMIKAGLAQHAETGDPTARQLATDGFNSLFHYYINKANGIWCDQIDADNVPLSTTIPASSLYHIMMAVGEWHRLTQSN